MHDLNKMFLQQQNQREREYRWANAIVAMIYTGFLALMYYYVSPALAVFLFVYFLFLNLGAISLYVNNKIAMKD